MRWIWVALLLPSVALADAPAEQAEDDRRYLDARPALETRVGGTVHRTMLDQLPAGRDVRSAIHFVPGLTARKANGLPMTWQIDGIRLLSTEPYPGDPARPPNP